MAGNKRGMRRNLTACADEDFSLSLRRAFIKEPELAARRARWKPRAPRADDAGSCRKLFLDTVRQANRGCDFDFPAAGGKMRIPEAK